MSDARLRELERLVAQADPGARAALLRERARMGLLDVERLEFAAYCSSVDAMDALGGPSHGAAWRTAGMATWMEGLGRWLATPYFAPLRAAVAIQRMAVHAWQPPRLPGGQIVGLQDAADRHARLPAIEAVECVAEWLAETDAGDSTRAARLLRRAQSMHDGPLPWSALPYWVRHLLSVVHRIQPGYVGGPVSGEGLMGEVMHALERPVALLGVGRARGLAQAALIDWALA